MVYDRNGDIFVKRIIVAVDGSVHSEKALDHAIKLAKAFGAEMQIVHAIKHVEITKTIVTQTFSSKAALSADELYEGLKREAASGWKNMKEKRNRPALLR